MKLSIFQVVALVRAAYQEGGGGYDPFSDEEEKPLSDGDALNIAVDCLGGCEVFAGMNRAQRITAAAIPQEIAEVMEELRSGALLSVGNELRGCELSEAFSALVYDLLSDQIEQGGEAGGVQV